MSPDDHEKFLYELNAPIRTTAPDKKKSPEKVSDAMIEMENEAFFAVAGLSAMHGGG